MIGSQIFKIIYHVSRQNIFLIFISRISCRNKYFKILL